VARGKARRGQGRNADLDENEILFILTLKFLFNINTLSSAAMAFRPVPCGASFVLSEGSPSPFSEKGNFFRAVFLKLKMYSFFRKNI